MSQIKNSKQKAQITFCNADFFKLSKQKVFTTKVTKQKSIEKENSVSKSITYNNNKEIKNEKDKDKIIQKLNFRISELEARIKKLEGQQATKTEKQKHNYKIVMTEPSSPKKRVLSTSLSSKKIFTSGNKKELTVLAKSHIGLIQNIKSLSKTKFRNLSLGNLKNKKMPGTNHSNDIFFSINTFKRNNSVDQDMISKNSNKRNSHLKTETTWDISSTSSITNTTSNITGSINNSNKNAHNIKTIPKIPKRNESNFFITCNGNSINTNKDNNLNDIVYYKTQFELIKSKTQNIIQKLIDTNMNNKCKI